MKKKSKDVVILELSEEILSDFDLNQVPLEIIISKCKKIARLKNYSDILKWFTLELSGYDEKSLPNWITRDEADKMAYWSNRCTIEKGIPIPAGFDISKLPEDVLYAISSTIRTSH
jgi:hypothetical protein